MWHSVENVTICKGLRYTDVGIGEGRGMVGETQSYSSDMQRPGPLHITLAQRKYCARSSVQRTTGQRDKAVQQDDA